MTKPILAAQLYTVRDFTQTAEGLSDALHKIRAMGYSAVQISAIGPIDPAKVKSILDETGLTVCITHIPCPPRLPSYASHSRGQGFYNSRRRDV